MRKLILLVGAILVSSSGFAGITDLSKNSTGLKALSSVWQSPQTAHIASNQKHITMVYGGEDVSRKVILDPSTVA